MKKAAIWLVAVLIVCGMSPVPISIQTEAYSLVGTIGTPVIYSNGANGGLYLAQKTSFTVGTSLPDSALALHFRLYIARVDNAQLIDGFSTTNGQVELSSSGSFDRQAVTWKLCTQYLQAGWNEILLPFEAASFVNGTGTGSGIFNKGAINWFRIYNYVANSAVPYTFAVDNVEIVNISTSIRLPSHYGSGMLFERGKPIVLTGSALQGHVITAIISNGSTPVAQNTATVQGDDTWQLSLPAMQGGYTRYNIQLLDNGVLAVTLYDIVVGELWLAAGQSNMQFSLWQTPSAQSMLTNPSDEFLRYLDMPGNPTGQINSGAVPYYPQTSAKGAYWGNGRSNSSMLYMFSAVAYYFAEKLRAELDMPVGILNVPMGATSIYAWLSREAIDGNEKVKEHLSTTGRYRVAENWNQAGEGNFTQITAMYNQKVAPLTHLNIKGMIWYQGEADSWDEQGCYREALNLLLSDYSARFGFAIDSMPLIFNHLAPLRYDMDSRTWEKNALFGEEESNAWKDHSANVAQIPIYDIPLYYQYTPLVALKYGGDDSIHPYTKQPVGERMAQAAMGLVYGKSQDYTAPVYSSISYSGDSILVKFDHIGDGLTVAAGDSSLRGFTIAGADGVHIPAKAEILSGDTVRVWSDTVKKPLTCTYAFTEMNMNANLFSTLNGSSYFPAVPFRTSSFSGTSYFPPQEWAGCDLPQIWHSSGFGKTAKFYDSWQKGILSAQPMTFSYSTAIKTQGKSSLQVDYTTDSNKAFDPAPTRVESESGLVFADTGTDFSKIQTVRFDVKNASGRELVFAEMLIKGLDGAWYRPLIVGLSSYGKSIGTSADWQTITLDLTRLNKIGEDPGQVYSAENLSKTSNIQFDFYDLTAPAGSTGTIYLDNFVFGFHQDKPEVDKRSLFDLLLVADTIDPVSNNYSLKRYLEYTDRVDAAKSIMDNPYVTQEEVDAAAQALLNDPVINNPSGTGAGPAKISLGSFYNATGTTLDIKSNLDKQLLLELNTSWNGQTGQLTRTVGFGANLTKTPYLVMKIQSADFPFQLLFRYKGGEFDDGNRTFLMIQDSFQKSATEKTYIFDMRNYFRTDTVDGTTVTTPYGEAWGQTKSIALTQWFEECAVNLISVPDASNHAGDKIIIKDIYLSPTGNADGLDDFNMASCNQVPAGATRISNAEIARYSPDVVFPGDGTISLTVPPATAAPLIISLDGVDIRQTPILFIDFKSSPSGSYLDFVATPAVRLLNSAAHSLNNFVVAVDLRSVYRSTDNKVLYLYNWNGYATSSTMVLNGIYLAPETVDPDYFESLGENLLCAVNPGTTPSLFRNSLQPGQDVSLTIRDSHSVILDENSPTPVGTGTTVEIVMNSLKREYFVVIYGDVDSSGGIDIADLASMKNHLLKNSLLSGIRLTAGGIFTSNKISIHDLLAVKKHITGLTLIRQCR